VEAHNQPATKGQVTSESSKFLLLSFFPQQALLPFPYEVELQHHQTISFDLLLFASLFLTELPQSLTSLPHFSEWILPVSLQSLPLIVLVQPLVDA